MNVGKLDRRLLIEQKSVAKNVDFGNEIITWTTVATVWGSAMDVLGTSSGNESVRQGIRVLEKPTRFVIRYRGDIKSDMRITIVERSRTFQIVSVAEIGRREYLELIGQEFTV